MKDSTNACHDYAGRLIFLNKNNQDIAAALQNPHEVYFIRGSNDIQYYLLYGSKEVCIVVVSINEFSLKYGVQNRLVKCLSVEKNAPILAFLNRDKLVYEKVTV